MAEVVWTDVRRILGARSTIALVLLALAIIGVQLFRESRVLSLGVSPAVLEPWAFERFMTGAPPDLGYPADLPAAQAPPLLRALVGMPHLQYIALCALVIFGGFYAHDARSGYRALRLSRGLGQVRLELAEVVTIALVSAVLVSLAMALMWAESQLVGGRDANSLVTGQLVYRNISFLPQMAATRPVLYTGAVGLAYVWAMTFLGLLGHLAARLGAPVPVAVVAPAVVIMALGRYVAPHAGWMLAAFDFDNLAFPARLIIEWPYVVRYVGCYPLWAVAIVTMELLLWRLRPGVIA